MGNNPFDPLFKTHFEFNSEIIPNIGYSGNVVNNQANPTAKGYSSAVVYRTDLKKATGSKRKHWPVRS